MRHLVHSVHPGAKVSRRLIAMLMLQGVQKACGHAAWLAYLRPKEKKPEEVLQGRCRVEGGKQATMPKQAGRALLPQGGFYLDSVGYGMESKKDQGETVRVQLTRGRVPIAALNAMRGMREGGKRRIVVTPNFGWTDHSIEPSPNPSAARRFWRFADDNTPILFEVDLVKVWKPGTLPV